MYLCFCLRDMGEFVSEVEKLGIKVFHLPQKQNGTDYFSFIKVAKIFRREKRKLFIPITHNSFLMEQSRP